MIERETNGNIQVMRLAHGKASAFDVELCEALGDELAAYEASDARALVMTGTGGIFSAGVDLVRLVKEGAPYVERFMPAFERATELLFRIEKPIVCALNGHAIAGGCVLACAGDHRIFAAGRARIGVPELLVGVPFPATALELVRRVWPPAHFQEAIYTGRSYTVDEARDLGLVDEVVEPESLMERAFEVAGQLASIPSRSFALTKRMTRRPSALLIEDHQRKIGGDMLAAWRSPEVLETIAAYVERTLKK
jgi:enoyl-CoA hydratase